MDGKGKKIQPSCQRRSVKTSGIVVFSHEREEYDGSWQHYEQNCTWKIKQWDYQQRLLKD